MSEDLRVIKTRSNIRKEFLSLLEQYEFRAITVSMIIERCQINRSTFYRNYEDKYALTDAIVQDLLEEFSRNMETAFIRESKAEPGSFNSMLEYFSQHRKELTLLYQRVLPVNIFDQMLTRYSEALLKEISRIFPNSVRQQKLSRYFSRIIASNILTSIRWWHLESPETSRQEMEEIIRLTAEEGILPSLRNRFK